jgi:N-acetylmuramoyl-L-alanine amidase
MVLEPVSPNEFANASGVQESLKWPTHAPEPALTPVMDERFVVVLDPGHGGVDPGAERDGVSEKTLMLDVAKELRAVLKSRGDVEVVLTRESDVFVSLDRRVAVAHRAGADLFLSLHADALSQGGAQGAAVYVLSDEASDKATAHLAERHNRADVLAGMDLTASDDQVTRVLLDIARRETEPRSEALALALVAGMTNAGGPMNRRPLRQAGFAVLKSADIPSVLVEVGFLSSKRDLENLRDPAWRSGIVSGMAKAIFDWHAQDRQRQALVRQ